MAEKYYHNIGSSLKTLLARGPRKSRTPLKFSSDLTVNSSAWMFCLVAFDLHNQVTLKRY